MERVKQQTINIALVFYLLCERKSGILQILVIKERHQVPE